MKKIIGILGGIGPEATASLYIKIIHKLQEKNLVKSNEDYPQIIINSIPAHELFIKKILDWYIKGIKELEKNGVNFIIIACNTAYLHFDKLQKEVKIPIINLKEEVKKHLDKRGINSLTVLGTGDSIKKGLYKFKDKKYLELKDSEIDMLEKIIHDFNIGKDKEKCEQKVINLTKKYLQKSTILGACTEISLILKNNNIPFIDTMDILTEATINKWKN